jgi:hypothetical protein
MLVFMWVRCMSALNRVTRSLDGAILRALRRLGVARGNVELYRNIALGFPVVIGEILAFGPLFFLADHQAVPSAVFHRAVIGLTAAVLISLVSPNWNEILAAGWLFLASRSVIGLVLVGGGLPVLILGLICLALAGGCLLLKRRPGRTQNS